MIRVCYEWFKEGGRSIMRKIITIDRDAREDLERRPGMQETPTHSAAVEKLKQAINEAAARKRRIMSKWQRKL
jgi:hypothetical protein